MIEGMTPRAFASNRARDGAAEKNQASIALAHSHSLKKENLDQIVLRLKAPFAPFI